MRIRLAFLLLIALWTSVGAVLAENVLYRPQVVIRFATMTPQETQSAIAAAEAWARAIAGDDATRYAAELQTAISKSKPELRPYQVPPRVLPTRATSSSPRGQPRGSR